MDQLTVGVEEELHVVDLATGALVPRGDHVLVAARPALGPLVTRELNLCQIETASPVCSTLDEVREHVIGSRAALAEAAASVGLGVAALGTHPTGRWQEQKIDRDQPRYRALEESYQALAHQQIICGCHVHVGFEDRRLLFDALGRVRTWLPVLLALSANSPFWQGADTGYASFRQQVWRRWPTAGLPPELSSEAEFDGVVEQLVGAGALTDASFLYWDARPSTRYATLEIRAFDTCLVAEDVVGIVGLTRALLWACGTAAERGDPAPACPCPEVLDSAMWRASRYGVEGQLLSPSTGALAPSEDVVAELLDHCAEGLARHGDADTVAAAVATILERGTGATIQRSLAGEDDVTLIAALLDRTSGQAPSARTAA